MIGDVAASEGAATSLSSGGDNRPSVYTDPDGTVVYRASALGSCLRSLAAHRSQIATPRPHSEHMLGIFAEGRRLEPIIIEWLGAQGWVLTDTGDDGQAEYDLAVFPGVVVRCHPDGMAVRRGEPAWTTQRVLEVKALGESLAGKGLYALTHYPWQLSIEMLSTGRKALYVVHNKGHEDVSDDSVVVKEIDTPPYTLAQIKARVAKVEAAVRRDELGDCSQKDFPCQWYGIVCQQQAMVRPEAETDDTVAALCHDLFMARRERKTWAERESEAKQALEAALGDRPRVRAGVYVAARTAYPVTRLDQRLLREKLPELFDQYMSVTETSKLTVEMASDDD